MPKRVSNILSILVAAALLAALTSVANAVAQDSPVGDDSPPVELLEGIVRAGDTSEPMGGVEIYRYRFDGIGESFGELITTTRPDGSYVLDVAAAGNPQGFYFRDPEGAYVSSGLSVIEIDDVYLRLAARVIGTVIDGNSPVAGIEFGWDGAQAASDEDGRFDIAVPPFTGDRGIVVRDPLERYATTREFFQTLGAGQTIERTVVMQLAGTIDGQVVDGSGTPLSGVPVYASAPEQSPAPDLDQRTDSNGNFSFPSLVPGPWHLRVLASGDFRSIGQVVQVQPGETDTLELVRQRDGLVRGQVTAVDGSPIPGVAVSAAIIGLPPSSAGSDITATDGTYEFYVEVDTAPVAFHDSGRLELNFDNIRWHDGSVGIFPGSNLDFAPDSTTDLDFVFDGAAWMSGIVSDKSGQPTRGVEVRRGGPDGTLLSRTDSLGRYRVNIASSGEALFYFTDPNDAGNDRYIRRDLVPNASIRQDVVLGLRPTIGGRVANTNGDGIEGIEVVVRSYDESEEVTSITDANGTYSAEVSVPAGDAREFSLEFRDPQERYLTSFYDERYQPWEAQYVYINSEPGLTEIDTTMYRPASLSGSVVDRDDSPVENANISIYDSTRDVHYSTETDADGVYVIEDVVPGQYSVSFYDVWPFVDGTRLADGSIVRFSEETIDLAEGVDRDAVDIVADRRPMISGRVVDPAGEPVEGADVGEVDGSYYVATDEDGYYEVFLNGYSFPRDNVRVEARSESDRTYFGGPQLADAEFLAVDLNDQLTGIDMQFAAPGSLEGQVTDDLGNGIPDAQVSIEDWNAGIYRNVQTDATGRYAVGLPVGSYYVSAHESSGNYAGGVYDPDGDPDTDDFVQIESAQTSRSIDVVLRRLGGLTVELVDREIAERDDVGYVSYYFELEATDFSRGYNEYSDGLPPHEISLTSVEPGEYYLRVERNLEDVDWNSEYRTLYYPGVENREDATHIVVGPEETVSLEFLFELTSNSSAIAGRITDAASGEPIPGAALQIIRFGGPFEIQSFPVNADGFYSADGVEPGQYFVSFVAPGYVSQAYPEWTDGLPIVVDFFGGANLEADVALVADAAKICNGLEVTVDIGAGDRPTEGPDVILGTDGSDWIDGRGGDDVICAGGGSDLVSGGAGDDLIFGGDAWDWIGGGDGADVIYGEGGDDWLGGNGGRDRLVGGDGDDNLAGHAERDVLIGGRGNDFLDGGSWADWLNGQAGDDTLRGRSGADTLVGGAGVDDCDGGIGTNTILSCEVAVG